MTELSPARLWVMRGAFLLLALLLILFQLLPLETLPRTWAGPDLLLCFACAWSLRRPEYVPAVPLALTFFLADLLLQRPPGLLALLTLIACENLKIRSRSLRDSSFPAEWLTVSVTFIVLAMANRLVLAIALVDLPPLTLFLSGLAMSVLVYPAVVLITHFAMGVRMAAPGDLDALGQRV
ncbi:MAG: rod shape-determining protein MreD [Pseudomonadota bacterium]